MKVYEIESVWTMPDGTTKQRKLQVVCQDRETRPVLRFMNNTLEYKQFYLVNLERELRYATDSDGFVVCIGSNRYPQVVVDRRELLAICEQVLN